MNEAELRLAIVEKMKEIAKENDCVLFLAITDKLTDSNQLDVIFYHMGNLKLVGLIQFDLDKLGRAWEEDTRKYIEKQMAYLGLRRKCSDDNPVYYV